MVGALVIEHRIGAIVRPPSGCVSQQVFDGNLVHAARRLPIFGTEHGTLPEHLVVQPQAAFLDKREDSYRSDWLADAANAEQMRRYCFLTGLAVGPSKSVLINETARMANRDGKSRHCIL